METPSGHPSSLTQISINSKQPKTLRSELSQAAPQTQTSNISTHRNRNTPTRNPPQTPCITTQTKNSCSYTSPSSTYKANPSRRQMKQTIFENTSFTTNLD